MSVLEDAEITENLFKTTGNAVEDANAPKLAEAQVEGSRSSSS